MISNKKSHFIVSYLPVAWPGEGEPLFIAEPFIYHLLEVNKCTDRYPEIKVADFQRKGPEDLYTDNELLWKKYHKYIPYISEWLNNINNVRLPIDFWRRALSMGLMRHLTMLYDFFKICEANFNPNLHQVNILSPDCYYIPINYDEHRAFFQHSHYGQEQFLSLYINCFYAGIGRVFSDEYKSKYAISILSKNWDSDPVVGIMGTLFEKSYVEQLDKLSRGDINLVGIDLNFPVANKISDKRHKTLNPKLENSDRFDAFFFYSLPTLIPREFIEDFSGIFQSISSQFERYKRLSYVVSEIFIGMSYESIALAVLSLKGIKVVYSEHNYSEYPYYPSILNQQVSIADIFAAHGNYSVENLTAVHTGSLFNFVDNIALQNQKIFHAVYISGIGQAKYSNYSSAYGEVAEKALAYLNFKFEFLSSLPKYILKDILYRPYPVESSWELCYNEGFILQPIYSQLNIDQLKGSAKQRMVQSRLVIIDYVSTSHLESFSMNIPTIIIINEKNYVLDKKYLNFFEDLMAVGIVHTDPQKAADFLKEIWENPEAWWSGPEVQNAKNSFLKKNLGKPKDLINFLVKLSQMNRNQYIGDLMDSSLASFIADSNRVYVNKNNSKPFNYSDGEDREDFVFKTLKSVSDLSLYSDELRKSIHDWVSEYHFSQARHNLLRHLKLNTNMNILELGCGCGSITRQLGESGANITAVEGSYNRARSAAARCRDLNNVKVYCSNFQDIDFQKKYDVVTLIGVMEYSPLFFNSDDPIGECLNLAFGALKDDGVLIIAIENQLGLKYFAGYHEDHTDIRYFGIEDKYNTNTAVTFGRKELTRLLNRTGMQAVEFQYPFPDYKIPKVVFTSKAFNNDSFSPEGILSQLKHRDYSGEVFPSFDLGMAINPLCRNGLMEDLSNSFLVFASEKKENISRLFDRNLIAAFYTTDRTNKYNVKTSFLESSDGIRVRKEALLEQKNGLPDSGILKHELREENYLKGKNLEGEYRKCILNKDLDQLGALIGLQINFIINNAISSINQQNIALSEIKADYIDCVPSNLIYENGTLHLIDKEWEIKRPVSLGALLMRTVEVLSALDGNLPELKKENLIMLFRNMGLNLDNNILQEYDRLIEEIVAQVYTVTDLKSNKPESNFNEIQYFLEATKKVLISKKSSMPETASLADRLCSHIDEMILVYNGYYTERYFEKIRNLGPAERDEISICEKLIKKMEGDQGWNKAREFTARLIMDIRTELEGGLPVKVNSEESNPLKEYKKFNYGEEFLGFLCPNPFLYMELREGGEVSPCCYLPFTLGNISNSSIEEIWNSEKAQELRNSILMGEYSYCDKKKCAAMQAISLPENGQGKYQIPYQLQVRKKVDNLTLKECVITGRADNLPNPEILSFEDDPSCNLSCPSCRGEVRALKAKESHNALLLQKKLMDSMGENLREIWLCGAGDAFAANSYRSFLQKYDFSQFPDLKLRIDTNGMLFNQNTWENTLKAVQNKIDLVAVSVDAATAPTYEALRRGGKFETLMNNLKFISELPQRKKGMRFIIRMIVQKKNFREMKKFIDLGISLKVDHVVFSVLQNWGTFSDEEYREQAVHLKNNQFHGELCEVLKDEIFLNEIVDLGNLSELYFKVSGKGKKVQTSIIESSNYPVEKNCELKPKARVIAFYLPQYHPIPENDKWWGKGFTEWTNVGKAHPLYQGHLQPKSPSDLGYYDLRIPEARRAQADLAKKYGIEAFCYWHYWFAGHRLLERPFNEVVKSGEPDLPFCLGWANQTWSGIWHGAPNRILIEQTYPGLSDYKAHFYELLPAFSDKRYLRINGKLVFLIYSPTNIPDAKQFTEYWQNLALKEGLPGFHFIAHMTRTPEVFGCESCVDNAPFYDMKAPLLNVQGLNGGKIPRVNLYSDLVKYLKNYRLAKNEFPIVFPNWDNTPRSGANGLVLHGSTPELFQEMMHDAVSKAMLNPDPEMRIVFVKAWNEWAEGNHLEPDILYGHKYLEVVKKSIFIEK